VGVELVGRVVAERRIEERLRDSGITGEIDVTVGRAWWRPTVWPALVTGDVDRVLVAVTDGELVGLPVRSARYVLSGIEGDISVLDGTVAVERLDRGSVRIVIDPAVIGQGIGADLRIQNGQVVAGETAEPVEMSVEGDQLVLRSAALAGPTAAPSVPVVDPYLLPCRPDVGVRGAAVVLSCSGGDLPGVLRSPLVGDGDLPPAGPADLPPPQSTVITAGPLEPVPSTTAPAPPPAPPPTTP
jgi:hypothetical protein